jgi:hypothetical protein
MVLSAKLIDVRNTQGLARTTEVGNSDAKSLPRMIGEAVRELVTQSGL